MATAVQELSAADTSRAEVDAYLAAAERKSLLRFITCGSVDDGKSTLIGRLLYDSRLLFEDQLAALAADSRQSGTQGSEIDFALLVDGLSAEREQGITIDVAYRYFATDKRKFIVADTPGHEQYTRNMITGASTADLAVILIDARKGVLEQTKRHSLLARLLGVRHLVLAVNKMDLVGYDPQRFEAIVAAYRQFAGSAGIGDFTAIPLSGLTGDNVISRSLAMPWYQGPSLLEHLEVVEVARIDTDAPFRMAVQWVNRPDQHFRGYAGRIASGSIRRGDAVTVLPSGQRSRVERIATFDGDLADAVAGQSVTLTLANEIDCSRGDIIVGPFASVHSIDAFSADLVWMADQSLVPGRAYWLKLGTQTISAVVRVVNHVTDVNSLDTLPGRPLALNDIGFCELRLDRPVAAVSYAENRQLGGFILIDKISNATVAAGMIRAWDERSLSHHHAPAGDGWRIYWLAGETAAERAALAAAAQERLRGTGRTSLLISEELLRRGLANDLGQSAADHVELLRRAREVARLVASTGATVLVTLDADDAHPGRRLTEQDLALDGEGEWII